MERLIFLIYSIPKVHSHDWTGEQRELRTAAQQFVADGADSNQDSALYDRRVCTRDNGWPTSNDYQP